MPIVTRPSKCASGVVSSTSSASSASSRPCSSGWGAGGCAMELRAVLRPPPLKRFPPRSSLRGLQVRGIFPATKRHFRQISPRRRLSAARSRRRGDALLPGGLQRTDPGQAQNVKQDTARQDGRHRVRHQIKARLKQASSAQPTLPSTRISPLYTVQCTLKSTESHDDSRCCPVYGLRDTFNALALYSKG